MRPYKLNQNGRAGMAGAEDLKDCRVPLAGERSNVGPTSPDGIVWPGSNLDEKKALYGAS